MIRMRFCGIVCSADMRKRRFEQLRTFFWPLYSTRHVIHILASTKVGDSDGFKLQINSHNAKCQNNHKKGSTAALTWGFHVQVQVWLQVPQAKVTNQLLLMTHLQLSLKKGHMWPGRPVSSCQR